MLLKGFPKSISEEEGKGWSNGDTCAVGFKSHVNNTTFESGQSLGDTSRYNGQILEPVTGGCKNQLIPIAQAGIGKLQRDP